MKSLATKTTQTHDLPAVAASEVPNYENTVSDVKYQNLVSQLNPHFLFNSLATLESLIYSDQRLAVKFLSQLTRVYRYVLTTRNAPLVPLLEELNFIKDYADLLQTRFGKGLQVIVNVSPQYHERRIVPVVLQILIENATRHNITDIDSPLIIQIGVTDDRLFVENNLQKKVILETKRQEALKSLSNLYAYFSDVAIEIQQTQDTFRVSLPLI
ncbi:MAG: histidine kinase [Spirosomataceae bacterium]